MRCTWMPFIFMIFLGFIITMPVYGQEDVETDGFDTMIILDMDESPADIDNLITLPENASEEALEHSSKGKDAANKARKQIKEKVKEAQEQILEQAEEAIDNASEQAEDVRLTGLDRAEEVRNDNASEQVENSHETGLDRAEEVHDKDK